MTHSTVRAEPARHEFWTPGVYFLIAFTLIAVGIAIYRFLFGLAATTNLDQEHPWGIWIALDVATGVALAAGGFTTAAALTHIFHRHRYEVLVRPALLTAMLGYTFVALGLTVDLGRYYNMHHPLLPSMWQGNSVLFEVGMCVVVYLNVLYIEFLPVVCERFIGAVNLPGFLAALNRPVDRLLRFLDRTLSKVMFLFIIAGVVLSCMHQSSLGGLLLIAPYKVHPLWYTPVLPFLFLLSAIAVGYPMVIFESLLASKSFGRKPEMSVLTPLSRLVVLTLGIYLIAKAADLLIRDAYVHVLEGSLESWMFLVEICLGGLLPMGMLLSERVRHSPNLLLAASTLVVVGVAINRINVFLVAYQPPFAQKAYFPSLMEIFFTVGMVAALMLVYRAAVTIFPILPRERAVRAGRA
ncbi:MAG: Ni/Fe-hydrogenase cytochrome b subunit [Candidatus Omnitrophica bacterium]|nr:putative Ni/Fe-hydrogenase 2 b-type cytochrome subunit [bacterium]NUN96572.1 Ni/Fe-hydrogenase cytochrome b subunit [Candidatus Omnitrophota bacterium]